ncbi:MAG: inositol phosphorylceramide synthase [Bacteroidetes bacterium]|nr:inositol phosphorylceramide synthase [Bacteroidota bacterium]
MNHPMRRDEFLSEDNSNHVAGNVPGRPSLRFSLLAVLLSLVYLAAVQLTIGLRPEHVFLVSLFDVGLLAHPASGRVMRALAIFLVFGILYDSLKIVPNYQVAAVDIEGLYNLELQLFGIVDSGMPRTPNEYLHAHASAALDLISGLFYLNWVSVPILFGVYLYVVDKRRYIDFGLVFLLVNILGFIGYYLHPAAPPWYVDQYGFTLHTGVFGSAAELVRFDRLVGLDIFQGIYTRNSNVFAAVPSLHSAYPVVVLWFAIKQLRHKHRSAYFAVYMMGIWFAAVYSGHHYVIDVILGAAVAVAGILLYEQGLLRIPAVRRWLARYERSISR